MIKRKLKQTRQRQVYKYDKKVRLKATITKHKTNIMLGSIWHDMYQAYLGT